MPEVLDAGTEQLIGQWVQSPKVRAHIQIFTDILKDDFLPAIERLRAMRVIETAEGVWLDYIGVRLGLPRPATTDPAQDDRFGFSDDPDSTDTSGLGFDNVPFRGGVANDAVYPLPDALYRRFLKSRAILDIGDGTFQTFSKAVRAIDPGATVQDKRDMTVRIVTDAQTFLELADMAGALPRTAGVRIIFADRGSFGLSDDPDSTEQSGVGFDQGGFRVG